MVFLRGGGDLASGVALRLYRAGFRLIIMELPQPRAVRRMVSFASAMFTGETIIEGIVARRTDRLEGARSTQEEGFIPILADPQAEIVDIFHHKFPHTPLVLIDGRMLKQPSNEFNPNVALSIGLGPGYTAGVNCHAVVETHRGHTLGRVIWRGEAESDTGVPDRVANLGVERVLRSPADGILIAFTNIGEHLEKGQVVAEVAGEKILAPFDGVLRGLIQPGLQVWKGLKIGDLDPRNDPRYAFLVSDKALAIGGGVLEAILSYRELRPYLWE